MLGDPDKKQQNEPSCDINPNNSMVVFCGMNDYRAVDRPEIVGEPFVGASFSMDGGLTWKSHLHPGFKPKLPGAPAPLVTPIGYETAADPVVRLVPGMGLFNFIAFDRQGKGALLLSRWYERNTEGGFPYGWRDTVEVAKGTGSPGKSGNFLDKPAMTVSLLPGTSTYNFVVPDPAQPGATRSRKSRPASSTSPTRRSRATTTRTAPKSSTPAPPTTATAGRRRSSARESRSIRPRTSPSTRPANRVVVVWRRFANPNNTQGDAIMYVLSNDGGMSFSKPAVLSNLCSFTQNTTAGSFRSTTHPFVTFDGRAFHAVWAARQGSCPVPPNADSAHHDVGPQASGQQRAVVVAAPGRTSTTPRGHEFMPSIVASGNRLLVSWLDTRNDLRPAKSLPFPIRPPIPISMITSSPVRPRLVVARRTSTPRARRSWGRPDVR